MANTLKANTLAELYQIAAEQYGDHAAFAVRDENKKFHPISYRELFGKGAALATALMEIGVRYKDHVGLISDNRLEWIIADYGVILAGAADVPRGTDVTDADINYILPHSDAKVVFIENDLVLKKFDKNKDELKGIQTLIMMDPNAKGRDGILRFYDLIKQGEELRAAGDRRVEDRIKEIQPDDLFTIIYTSGTTGTPKGVMLMHSNMIYQVRSIPEDVAVGPKDRMLTILPVWHIFERVFEMIGVTYGCTTYYTSVRNIKEDLILTKPTFMASAPRIWESVYLGIKKKVEQSPKASKKLFGAAYFCAERFKGALRFLTFKTLDIDGRSLIETHIRSVSAIVDFILFLFPYLILDIIVLRKIRVATGGKIKGSVSGGGALPTHIDEFFNNIGVPVLEGYGMTETAPVIAVRTNRKLVIGTVGPVYSQTGVMVRDINTGDILYPPKRGVRGELYYNGPSIMKGYYKNPEATNAVLKDGWLNSGDLGMITYNNCLKILGRTKDTIVLFSGENVEPLPIEVILLNSPMIDNCMVVGQDRKYLGVLIVPSLEYFSKDGSSIQELSENATVLQTIKDEVKAKINNDSSFKSFEKIQEVRLVPKSFDVGDEITSTYKIRRYIVSAKYEELIDSMYE